MNRCVLAFVVASALSTPALAQRMFERDVLRGDFRVTAPPEAELNDKPVRLAPGARIRNAQNMIQLSGGLIGQKLLVNYRLDGLGQVQDVWILSEAEAAKTPWPRTREEAQSWAFDPALQRWSKP
jgi:hypothetical protein